MVVNSILRGEHSKRRQVVGGMGIIHRLSNALDAGAMRLGDRPPRGRGGIDIEQLYFDNDKKLREL